MSDKPTKSGRETVIMPEAGEIRLQRCKLVQVTGDGKNREFILDQPEVSVGSGKEAGFRIDDPTVSSEHFSVSRNDQTYMLHDLGSTNGTYLDDARVKEAYLRPGGVIRAGEVFFRFEPVYERIDLVPAEQTEFGTVRGKSFRMREIFAVLEKVAPTDATVLLEGDTGTGKGAVAKSIHHYSNRSEKPFIVFDCGAITPTLVESELFGHERGAFTGAVQQRKGALEEASGGTLFIDELSDLALELQPKLLRALEEREFTRLGSHKSIKVDCRILAATQRDLWTEVKEGRFREDLYFRLAVVTVPLPPLRQRREDIPMIVEHFLGDLDDEEYEVFEDLPEQLRQKLQSHEWPGNIRELRNTVERIALMQADPFVRPNGSRDTPDHASLFELHYDLPFKDAKDRLISMFEKEYLTRLLRRAENNIAKAARIAQIDRKHLYTLLSKHNLVSER